MNVVLVDDENLALDILENYIERLDDVHLLTRCNNALEAFDALHRYEVDLLFLDIQMPQITGIDFLKTLAHPPKVVFTTAYSNYAPESYELNVLDYLLKPIAFERFEKAIEKARQALGQERQEVKVAAQATRKEEPKEEELDYIFVKADKKLIKLRFEDIYYIEGLKDYVMIHSPQGRIVTLQTMKSLEYKLPSEWFMRIHRSYIANLHCIASLEGNSIKIQGKTLPIGKNYKDKVLEVINKNRL